MPLRNTATRQAIAKLLADATTPLTVPEMLDHLSQNKGAAVPHKTTIYREVERLIAAHQVQLVMLPDGVARYEYRTANDHHHHAVCEGCGVIAELSVPENLAPLEKAVAQQTGFTITGHVLEFLGRCRTCVRTTV
jgi:Fur family ferric uptake transcriptional regulator